MLNVSRNRCRPLSVKAYVKRLGMLLTLTIVVVACVDPETPREPPDGDAPPTTAVVITDTTKDGDTPPTPAVVTTDTNDEETTVQMLAAAIGELVSKDHTFGQGPPPFTEYLIQANLDPSAGNATGTGQEIARGLTDAERTAIEAVVRPFGPVRWIEDPDEWRTSDLRPVIEGAVILGVGEPSVGDKTGLVPVSLWCGGLCGTWLTYRLDLVDGAWKVTGTEGPIAIS